VDAIERIPALVKDIYRIVGELESAFPGRKFTPDGHLVGSLGEVLAAYHYDLDLLPGSHKTHDAKSNSSGRLVQVKATQGKLIGIREKPKHLIVLRLLRDGSVREVFNGPGSLAWNAAGPMQKNGQRPISVSKLQKLMSSVSEAQRLPSTDLPMER
jgi:hypothetical protein